MSSERENGNATGNGARMEQMLRASELSYRRLFEAAQDGILILDVDTGRITDVNPFLFKLLGFPRGEMVGKTVGELSPFKDIWSNEVMLARLQKDGYVRYHDLPLETRDGRKIAVEFVSNVYQAGDKKVIQCNIRDITAHKKVENAAIRLAAIIESSDDAIIGKDLDGTIQSWNTGAEKLFGYSAGEMTGTSMIRLIPADRQDEENQILEKIRHGESVRNFETVWQARDGRWIDVSVTVSPIKDSTGKIVGASKVARDITERKRVEAALRQSEEQFRLIMENLADLVAVLDLDGRRLYNSPSYREILGDPDKLRGSSSFDQVHPEDRARVQQAFQETVRTGLGQRLEYRLVSQDGHARYIESQGSVIRDAQGRVSQVVVVSRDVTERKRVEGELHRKTAFLEALLESSLDGILVVSNQGKKMLQNQRTNDLWKIPPHIAENKDDAVQVQFVTAHTKNPRQFADKVACLYSHPDEVSRDEVELVDGTFLDRYSSPVRDKAGKHYGRIWTFRDITEQRQMEWRLRQSQKMEAIGKLAGGVAHDFNNILAIIQMEADLLQTDESLSAAQLEAARGIANATQRAAALTRQLLLFSRKQTLQLRDLDLNESISEMTKMLRRVLGEDIQLQFKFAMQPLFIHADAGMLNQVLMNLAVNARDAMPKGGQLVVETSAVDFDESVRAHSALARPGSFVCLSVSDTGSGIPPENLPRIFEPFFTTKDVGKGTGLGLATVFGIVQQHQGWINVYSEAGHGTVFRIYVPRLAGMSRQEPEQPALTDIRGGDETILLVEDEAPLRASERKVLSQLGYRVLEAINGIEALEIWNQNRGGIHLLLTDLVMPGGMTGKDLGERLLKESPGLKVIYTSGYGAEVAGKNFPLEDGVNFLTKPFLAHKLAQTVRNFLDKD